MEYVSKQGENGIYANGKITISLDSDNPLLAVATHEFVHSFKDSAPEAYRQYQSLVINYLKQADPAGYEARVKRLTGLYQEKSPGAKIDEAYIQEEIVANSSADMLTDRKFVESLTGQKTNIAQRILDAIEKIWMKIRGQLKTMDNSQYKNYEIDLMRKSAETFEKARDLFREMVQESSGINVSDMTRYSLRMQNTISEYMESVDEKMFDIVKEHRINKHTKFVKYKMSDVSMKEASIIKDLLGEDVSGYSHEINTNAINHIERRHGENGQQDHSMANINDVARMPYVLKNFDSIEILYDKNGQRVFSKEFLNQDGSKAPLIAYKKRINGTYYIIEAVVVGGQKKLRIVSSYIQKRIEGEQTLTNANAPRTTSDNVSASSSIDVNISQPANGVNIQYAQTSESNTEKSDTPKYQLRESASPMRNLLESYGSIPKGVDPSRDIQVPKKTSDNKNVRRDVRTVLESKHITDEMIEPIQKKILDEVYSYEPVTDPDASAYAMNVIKKEGYDQALMQWKSVVYGDKIADKNSIALGQYLLKAAADAGDAKQTLMLIGEIAAEGTSHLARDA